MPRYTARSTTGSDPAALADFISRELRSIEQSIKALYDGEIETTVVKPTKNQTVLVFGDSSLDLGDGTGMYLKVGQQWYKLQMTPVASMQGLTGGINVVGGTPTIGASIGLVPDNGQINDVGQTPTVS